MKRFNTVITAVFIIMAALLGWCLPLAEFNAYDQINDGRQMDLEIEQINLSYRDDLTMNQKINLANFEDELISAIELDKGIFVQKEGLAKILGDFLADFTGYRFDITRDWFATPMLVNLSNNRGNIVVWAVQIWLNDGWEFQCYVDDKTGAILRCSFYGDSGDWENLVLGFDNAYDQNDYLSSKFRTAIYNHYASRLGAKIVTYHLIADESEYDSNEYLLVFKDDRNYSFELTVNFSIPYGNIETY
ncbi:MAG: hypothetical protein IKG30_04385 [Clostridiales bacterium]|nr:hypothetical protein [Clostridiales bacterium]